MQCLKAAVAIALHTMTWRRAATFRHCITTGDLARELACKYYDFSMAELEAIKLAGYMHDFGKLHIPHETLMRERADMTEADWCEIRKHPVMSVSALRSFMPYIADSDRSMYERICTAVYHHHCRFDDVQGKGYPVSRQGTLIPLWARMIAVCDTYSAMTEPDRPYRTGKSKAEALAEIEKVAGTQLDPRIAEQFCRMMSTGNGF